MTAPQSGDHRVTAGGQQSVGLMPGNRQSFSSCRKKTIVHAMKIQVDEHGNMYKKQILMSCGLHAVPL